MAADALLEDLRSDDHRCTCLADRRGKPIKVGQVVHWTDGGDNLSLEERIKTRWDRIAVVSMKGILPQFTVIDSPHEKVKQGAYHFRYGNFMYQDTEKYLTIVAESEEEYHRKFQNAGQCMQWVLENTSPTQNKQETT